MNGFTRSGDVYIENNACRILLTRGQRGTYGWEIRLEGSEPTEVIAEIEQADKVLRTRYIEEGTD